MTGNGQAEAEDSRAASPDPQPPATSRAQGPVLAAEMKSLAASSPGREICGFLLELEGKPALLPMDNVASADLEWRMDDQQLLDVYRDLYDSVRGVYHSHPNGRVEPSQPDLDRMVPHWRYFIIAGGRVYEYSAEHSELVGVH